MFTVVAYKNNMYYIKDSNDGVVEQYTVDQIKHFVNDLGIEIRGIYIEKEGMYNPIFTPSGLSVALDYKNKKKFGRWVVVVLDEGDLYGSKLDQVAKHKTVMFYDFDAITKHKWNRNKYPYGQFVSSYYIDSLIKDEYLNGIYGLALDTSVPSWVVDGKTMMKISNWLVDLL